MSGSAYAAVPLSAGTETNPVADDLEGITDSADLSTSVVASGFLFDADKTLASGVNVALYAWPDSKTIKPLVVGDTVNLQPVAKAKTNWAGKYTLRIASLSSLLPVADADGIVNFQIIARSGTQITTFSFPRKLAKPAGSDDAVLADTAADGADTEEAVTAKPAVATLRLSAAAEGSELAAQAVRDAADDSESEAETTAAPAGVLTAEPDGVLKDVCRTTYVKSMGPVWSIVGQTYSATTKVKHTFNYDSGASSDLGVGFSVSGGSGTWSQSGTFSTSSEVNIGYPTYGNNVGVYYKTAWEYGKYKYTCYNSAGIAYYHSYSVAPKEFAGGAKQQGAVIPTATKCTSYSEGSSFTRKKTKAVNWTNGVSLASKIGADLSAKTGYSSNAAVYFKFNADRHLCGVGSYPGGKHPYQFVAKG